MNEMDLSERRILMLTFLATLFLVINFVIFSVISQVSDLNLNTTFKAFIYLTLFISLVGILIMIVTYFDYQGKVKKRGILEEIR